MSLPAAIYSTAQVRALDRYAIEVTGIPGYTLMERAAAASLAVLRQRYCSALRVVIVCGGGNNGGDGYVLARLAHAASYAVQVLTTVSPDKLRGDARRAFADWLAVGGQVQPFAPGPLASADVIVDALCGIGLDADLRADARAVVQAINESGRPVLAIDVPSGLHSDTGGVMGAAVDADVTVTFVGLKQGLLLGAGPRLCGHLEFDALGIVAPERAEFVPRLRRLTGADLRAALPPRPRDAHKGLFGSLLVVGGGAGMPGAAALAAKAALRAGCGRVRVACDPGSAAAVAAHAPEIMVAAVIDAADLDALLPDVDTVLLGPGLGQNAWSRACWQRCIALCHERSLPLVIDADGLNLLAESPAVRRPTDCILTPHPGEAARLIVSDTKTVQADRLAALDRLTKTYEAVVALKGAGTLIGARGQTSAICTDGNPGMASAGMGDVLAGTIAGLRGQVHDAWRAATLGVLAHARAGDVAARSGGERGLLASDVIDALRAELNPR